MEEDELLGQIADYVIAPLPKSEEAWTTARLALMDAIGCGLLAIGFPACERVIGPVVPGAVMAGGARVPGTSWELDPVRGAFSVGAAVRWLDFNDTWLAQEWGHPSDNLGAILAVADWIDRRAEREGGERVRVSAVLEAMIRAYEIQGVIALDHAFNRVGLDHVLLVRVASAAVATRMMGGGRQEIVNAVSNAFLDGGALRTYRHAPNTGSRKSWAAGDATSRGVWLALMARKGEMGYPTALSAPGWGFQDVVYRGRPLGISKPLGTYVMANILFKISFPAEFHAQTAVEAAIRLHPRVVGRLDDIQSIRIDTQESAVRIIDKAGDLKNPADRDHCLQYMVAVGLLKGGLTADDYEDDAASDPRIDELRRKMVVSEDARFAADYLDPGKRSIGNAVRVVFRDGTETERVVVEYPIGHRRRRAEGVPLLWEKFERNARSRLSAEAVERLMEAFENGVDRMTVADFVGMMV